MSICARCPFCLTLPGYPHVDGCQAPSPVPVEPTLDATERLDLAHARMLDAWLHGPGAAHRAGYRPVDDTEPLA